VKSKLTSLCFLFLLLPVLATGQDNSNDFNERSTDGRSPRSLLEENGVNNLTPQRISRRQASNIASSRYEGRVLSIMLDNNSNSYRVRMDREGTVFNVFVNATSGDVSAPSN